MPPQEIVFLNFNYTKTITKYLGCINRTTTTTTNLHIHGELKNNRNPLIFGFGDEMDDHYKVLEKTNYNGFLDNMKSFGYFKTGNYQDLSSFINSPGPFEIFLFHFFQIQGQGCLIYRGEISPPFFCMLFLHFLFLLYYNKFLPYYSKAIKILGSIG